MHSYIIQVEGAPVGSLPDGCDRLYTNPTHAITVVTAYINDMAKLGWTVATPARRGKYYYRMTHPAGGVIDLHIKRVRSSSIFQASPGVG